MNDFFLGNIIVPLSLPLHNNIAVAMVMVIYYKIAMEVIVWFRLRFPNQIIASRYLLQMIMSSLIIFWPLFDINCWSWRLNILVPSVNFFRCLYKGAIVRDPNDLDVQNMSTTSSSPSDLLFGPLQTSGILIWLGLYQFMTVEAVIVAAFMLGDAVAPMIGSRYGRHIFQMPLSNIKTMEGSLVGVFMGTIAGSYTYLSMLGIPYLPLRLVLTYAFIAAVVEATAPGNLDNLVTTVVLLFSIDRVENWIPAL